MDRVVYTKANPKPEQSGSEYDAQALAWLEATNSQLEIEFSRTGLYFDGDKYERDIYSVTLRRRSASYTFAFGQSIAQSEFSSKRRQPSAYSILACLEKHNPGTFEEFCQEFEYDTDSRKAEGMWKACAEQYLRLDRMYSREEMDALAEIQ